MPIALLTTEERDASYSILVHAGSEYPTVRYRAHPINWHALVMQNTTIVWLSINLMWNLSSKVFARKFWNLLGLLFFPQFTHPSKCIVHAEYHYRVTVYRSDVQSELQSVFKFDNSGFYLFLRKKKNLLTKFSHIHRHAIVMQNTTSVWLSIDLMRNVSYKVITTLTLTGINFPPEFICVHQIQYYRSENKVVQIDVSACLI